MHFVMKLYMFRTVRLSIIMSLFTVHSAMVYVTQVCRHLWSRIRMELSPILVLLESCLQTCHCHCLAPMRHMCWTVPLQLADENLKTVPSVPVFCESHCWLPKLSLPWTGQMSGGRGGQLVFTATLHGLFFVSLRLSERINCSEIMHRFLSAVSHFKVKYISLILSNIHGLISL
jgi:hypothetical protein